MTHDTAGLARFRAQLEEDRGLIEGRVATTLSEDDTLSAAMRYALVGGKMLRGFLVLEGGRVLGLGPAQTQDAALAIECIHAYSLIHDDLPCMDDDDLRRGQPTVHRKWDEATAVLAGDALQTMAFELLAAYGPALVRSLAEAAGRKGMVGGQMLDIAAETADAPLDLDAITRLQAGKTGALIRWSAQAGAMIAGEDPAPFGIYGDRLGLAFQIADDVLDVEGDTETVGKAVGKDDSAGKATFVSLLGLAEAKRRASELVQDACDALSHYGERADTLRAAAQFVIARDK